jgi:hypothetical protein
MIKTSLVKQKRLIRFWSVALIIISAFLLTACSGSQKNSPAPTITPTPTEEVVEGGDISAVEPTKAPIDSPTDDPNMEPTETPSVEDVCSLVTTFDVENVLGQTVTSITPGSEMDDSTGSTINFCTYVGSGKAVVISSTEVDNSSIGGDALRSQLQTMQDDEPDTKINEELGVGVKAYWAVSEHAGEYVVLTEEHVFSVGLGGNIGNPLDSKAALLTLAQIVEKNQ